MGYPDPPPQSNETAFQRSCPLVYEDERGEATVNSPVASRTELWWDPRHPDEQVLWESKIYLGEEFFNEIVGHPVPLDMNALKALKRSSLGLDLYMWLTYRTFALQGRCGSPGGSCTASSE